MIIRLGIQINFKDYVNRNNATLQALVIARSSEGFVLGQDEAISHSILGMSIQRRRLLRRSTRFCSAAPRNDGVTGDCFVARLHWFCYFSQ